MTEIDRLKDQLARTVAGKAWHGPALMELPAELRAEKAFAKPIGTAHSIGEIVLHIRFWEQVVLLGLDRQKAEISEKDNWPQITDPTEQTWQEVVSSLNNTHNALVAKVASLSPTDLEQQVQGTDFTFGALIHGVIQHNIYHTGQIALLKKVPA